MNEQAWIHSEYPSIHPAGGFNLRSMVGNALQGLTSQVKLRTVCEL